MPRLRLPSLPYEPLRAVIGATCDRDAAEALRCNMREVVRWRTGGVPLRSADALAVRLWLHPTDVWGRDWHLAEEEAARLRAAHEEALVARRKLRQAAKRDAGWAEVMRSWRQWHEQQERPRTNGAVDMEGA